MGLLPPFAGVAVKVTLAPGQIFTTGVVMLTEGITALTFISKLLLVAAAGEAQGKLLVKTTVTILPFVKVVVLNVLLFVPTFKPFTFH